MAVDAWVADVLGPRVFVNATEVLPRRRSVEFVGTGITGSDDLTNKRTVVDLSGFSGGATGASANQFKDSVRLATAAALPANTRVGNVLTADANGALPNIDGQAPAVNDRVLVQTEGVLANNGVYDVTDVGSAGTQWVLTRSSDFDEDSEVFAGLLLTVREGTNYGDTSRLLSTNGTIIINTTGLQFSGAGSTPGLSDVLGVSPLTGANDIDITAGQNLDFQGDVSIQRQSGTTTFSSVDASNYLLFAANGATEFCRFVDDPAGVGRHLDLSQQGVSIDVRLHNDGAIYGEDNAGVGTFYRLLAIDSTDDCQVGNTLQDTDINAATSIGFLFSSGQNHLLDGTQLRLGDASGPNAFTIFMRNASTGAGHPLEIRAGRSATTGLDGGSLTIGSGDAIGGGGAVAGDLIANVGASEYLRLSPDIFAAGVAGVGISEGFLVWEKDSADPFITQQQKTGTANAAAFTLEAQSATDGDGGALNLNAGDAGTLGTGGNWTLTGGVAVGGNSGTPACLLKGGGQVANGNASVEIFASTSGGKLIELFRDGTSSTDRMGFWAVTPVVQPADLVALTDSTGGTANNTCVAISGSGADAAINDNFADLIAKYNGLRTWARSLGLMA